LAAGGDLGSLILLGIDRGNNLFNLIRRYPLLAMLAVGFDYLLSYFEKISFKKTQWVLAKTITVIMM